MVYRGCRRRADVMGGIAYDVSTTSWEGWYNNLYIDANYALFTTYPPFIIKYYDILKRHTGSFGGGWVVVFISDPFLTARPVVVVEGTLSSTSIVIMEKTARRTAANDVSFYR